MQNAQPTSNCATCILKVDYLSISKQQKNFGVFKMQGGVTIGHMATQLYGMGHICYTGMYGIICYKCKNNKLLCLTL